MNLIYTATKAKVYVEGNTFYVKDSDSDTHIYGVTPESGKEDEVAQAVKEFADRWDGFPDPQQYLINQQPNFATPTEVDAAIAKTF